MNIVIGMGEVGTALAELLEENDEIKTFDLSNHQAIEKMKGKYEYMHICFPYSNDFERFVFYYIKELKPKIVIIHSTLKVGTTRKIENATHTPCVHSPVIGQHDNLYESLQVFEKWIGTTNKKIGKKVYYYFKKLRMSPVVKSSPEVTELAKLLSTYRYGLVIARAQEEERICKQIGLDFNEVVKEFIEMYNEGYFEIDLDWVAQPNTYPGTIGGKCILPNLKLLEEQYPNLVFPKAIIESNNRKKNE